MKIEPFLMERMQSRWEHRVSHNLSESGVHPMSVRELLSGEDLDELLDQRLMYIQTNGTKPLRAAIAALYPGAGPENVLATNGTAEANYISIWRLVEPGDDVVMMLPNYMQIWGIVRSLGARIVPLRLREENNWILDPADLRKALTPRTRVIALCNPNNPTGSILPAEAMGEVAALAGTAGQGGAWILSDEVYRGAEREGGETASFWGMYDRLLITSGLSKAYGLPGLRIGWIAGPPGTIEELWGRKDYLTICPGAISDLLARRALQRETRMKILERTRGIIRENYPALEEWAWSRADALHMVPPRAGAIAYLRYQWPINSTELCTRLREEADVLIVPGDHFGMDGHLRIGFGTGPEELRASLSRIDPLLDSLS
jgi:aspartate/methionine/tyrosine aminotransferase